MSRVPPELPPLHMASAQVPLHFLGSTWAGGSYIRLLFLFALEQTTLETFAEELFQSSVIEVTYF